VEHPAPCIRSVGSIHSGFHRAFAGTSIPLFPFFVQRGEKARDEKTNLLFTHACMEWKIPYRRFFVPCGQRYVASSACHARPVKIRGSVWQDSSGKLPDHPAFSLAGSFFPPSHLSQPTVSQSADRWAVGCSVTLRPPAVLPLSGNGPAFSAPYGGIQVEKQVQSVKRSILNSERRSSAQPKPLTGNGTVRAFPAQGMGGSPLGPRSSHGPLFGKQGPPTKGRAGVKAPARPYSIL
jgi:hypothetical protein